MGFREDIYGYTSGIGLVGATPNPNGWSSGNVLVETGQACIFLKKLGLLDPNDANTKAAALSYCLPKDGFFSKLPGVESSASHDDVIGIVSTYAICGGICTEFLNEDIIEYGKDHWWVLSTTGKFYWDALTKPWHYAYYMLAADKNPNIIAMLSLIFVILYDALFNKKDSSGAKLIWMMIESLQGKSKLVSLTGRFWHSRIKKTWGSVQDIFKIYYGPNHIFTKYSENF